MPLPPFLAGLLVFRSHGWKAAIQHYGHVDSKQDIKHADNCAEHFFGEICCFRIELRLGPDFCYSHSNFDWPEKRDSRAIEHIEEQMCRGPQTKDHAVKRHR